MIKRFNSKLTSLLKFTIVTVATGILTSMVSSAAVGDSYEPNNLISKATSLSNSAVISATIHDSKDIDYYSFDTKDKFLKATISLANLPTNYNLALYNSKNQFIKLSSNTGTKNEQISLELTPGKYYIKVFPNTTESSANKYKLTLTTVAVLPVSGSEIDYTPEKWNDDGDIQLTTNCYAYALNLQRDPITGSSFPLPWGYYCLQPGELSQYSLDWDAALNDLTGTEIIEACKKDAAAIGGVFKPIARNAKCEPGTYKVALVISEGYDYHWYRQNKTGNWSHKPGTTEVVDLDYATPGKKIYDPKSADRGFYETFVGYFQVKSIPAGAPKLSAYSNLQRSSKNNIKLNKGNVLSSLKAQSLNSLRKGLSIDEVRNSIGLPSSLSGSGIVMDAYKLENGSNLIISYGAKRDVVKKAFILENDGTRKIIVE